MKTIEEKAKAYDKALERVKDFIEKQNPPAFDKDLIGTIYPELAESEDEKVRKALIDFFGKGAKYGGQTNGVYDKDILAWLEKQGETSPVLSNSSNIGKDEQNPALSDEDERLCQCLIEDQEGFLDEVNRDKYGHSEIISDLKEMYHERIDWIKSLKKRIGGKV